MSYFEYLLPRSTSRVPTVSDEELVRRYKSNFGLGNVVGLAEVRKHIALEAELTDLLASSSVADRWSKFSEAYSRLYRELPWLSQTGSRSLVERWRRLLKPGSRVLEVGSGAGLLLKDLADLGFDCVGTEMSQQRGEALAGNDGIVWYLSDGVHLDHSAPPASFDHVISDQVVEHLHPDDILAHFASARAVLKPGGTYVVRTPHRSVGPSDLSSVLGLNRAVFMHLHEFNYLDFEVIKTTCGYGAVRAVLHLPRLGMTTASSAFFILMVALDRIEAGVAKTAAGRRRFRRAARAALAARNVWVELTR